MRFLMLLIPALSFFCHIGRAATKADLQLDLLLLETSGQPAKRAENLKTFVKANSGTNAEIDAKLLEGITLLKLEGEGAYTEALSLFKDVMKQGRGTWREALATVSMTNALHVDGKHESVRAIAKYALESGVLAKLDLADHEMSKVVKNELQFEPQFYRDLMFEMLALAHKNLREPDEAGRIFAKISHSKILASYPNGIGTTFPKQPQLSNSTEKLTRAKVLETPAEKAGVEKLSDQHKLELLKTQKVQNDPAVLSNDSTSTTPWSIIVVLIVTSTGLLWLLMKKRK